MEWVARWVPVAPLAALLIAAVHVIYARVVGMERAAWLALAAVVPVGVGADAAIGAWVHGPYPLMAGVACVPGFIGYLMALGILQVLDRFSREHRLAAPWRLGLWRVLGCLAMATCTYIAVVAVVKRASHAEPSTWLHGTTALGCFVDPRQPDSPLPNPPSSTCAGIEPGTRAVCRGNLRAALWAAPHDGYCRIDVRDETGREQTLTVPEDDTLYAGGKPQPYVTCAARCVYRIEGEMWVVALPVGGFEVDAPLAFVDPLSRQVSGPTYRSFADRLAPPIAWTVGALVGIALGLLLGLLPRDRSLRARLSWREDVHDGKPCLVSPQAAPDTYRSTVDRTDTSLVVPGTRSDARNALLERRATRWMFATMTTVLLGCPLLVAAACGLLR